MSDWCVLQHYTEAQDTTSGQVTHTFTDGALLPCGFDPGAGVEVHETDKTKTVTYATLRLPWGTAVDEKDRIKLLTRSGETLAVPLVYFVTAPVQCGPTGVVVQLDIVKP